MKKIIKQDNNRIVALIMLYENRRSLIIKVLGVVVYFLIETFVCVDHLSLQKKPKWSSSHIRFEDNSFDEISGIDIPEILFNIVSCYFFVLEDK